MLSWGVAAGLDPSLPVGHLILPRDILGRDRERLAVDEGWHRRACERFTGIAIATGSVLCSERVIATLADKESAWRHSRAVALDMESLGVVRACAGAAVPALVVRAVTDTASRSVPRSARCALRGDGSVDLARLLLGLLRRPGELSALMQTAHDFGIAIRSLRAAALRLAPDFACPHRLAAR